MNKENENQKHIIIYILLVILIVGSLIFNGFNINKLNKSLNEKDEKISSLTKKLSNNNTNSEVEEANEEKISTISSLNKEKEDYETKIKELNEEIKKLSNKKTVITNSDEVSELNNKIIKLSNEKKKLNNKVNTLNKKIKELNNTYTVFYSVNNKTIYKEKVKKGSNVKNVPNVPKRGEYSGTWSNNGKSVKSNMIIYPKYNIPYYTLTIKSAKIDEEEIVKLSTRSYKIYADNNTIRFDHYYIKLNGKRIVTAKNENFPYLYVNGWYVDDDNTTLYTEESLEITKDTTLTFYGFFGCVIEGTKISMADGTTKNIEDVRPNDSVLSYDYYNGKISSKKVITVLEGNDPSRVFTVKLENGNEVKIVDFEYLFDTDSKKYIPINISTYKESIGKNVMVNDNGKINFSKIKSITLEEKKVKHYTMYSTDTINYIANNIIARTPTYFLNTRYEIGNDFKVDRMSYLEDVKKYGLYTYEDLKDVCTKETFDNYHLEDFKIVVGKGKISFKRFKKGIKELQEELDNSYKRFE